MKIKFLLLILYVIIFPELKAQENIHLNNGDPKNRQTVNVKLYDADNGAFLMEMPLTFHIMKEKERNILFMIAENKVNTQKSQTVWLFEESSRLDESLKKNRNFKVGKDFKKKNEMLESFYEKSSNITLIDFHNEFEKVSTATPKPFFFEVKDISKPFELKLKFYISEPDKDETMQMLVAKAGMVRITIDITN